MQLVVSPIVVCPPHLKSPLFTTHRKQEAVCNPLKLEYARLSLTRTARGGGISKASLDGVRSIVLRPFSSLLSHHIFRSISTFSNLFLAIATRSAFFFFFSSHIFLRACLFISTLERKAKKKKVKGGGCGRFYGYMRAWLLFDKNNKAVAFHSRFCFDLYLFFLLSYSSRGSSYYMFLTGRV